MIERRPMIAGNWKMHTDIFESVNLVKAISAGLRGDEEADVLVAPPFTNLSVVKPFAENARILLGAQNMHWEGSGAFTGEVSASMLRAAGCTHVILGHSERRHIFGESDADVNRKVEAAAKSGLIPIVCIGETLEEREAGRTFEVIAGQLAGSLAAFTDGRDLPAETIIAYEPVWAIGTGRTATPAQAQEVHRSIRRWLGERFGEKVSEHTRILYGGSVKPDNISALMSEQDIDGALVGGASLKAESFLGIVQFRKKR